MQVFTTVVTGVIAFVLGQIFQQYILVPIQEFGRQRADAIYFVVRFKDLTDSKLTWDSEEKAEIKKMRAALIYSAELVPLYELLTLMRIFKLPKRSDVEEAAKKIGMLADIVNSKSAGKVPHDMRIAEDVARLLNAKINLVSQGWCA